MCAIFYYFVTHINLIVMTTGKNIIMMVALMAYCLTSTAQSVKREYYDAWTKTMLMAEYQVNSVGEKHGWFKGYDREGVLIHEQQFKNNLWEGEIRQYSAFGGKRQLAKVENYRAGVLHGPAKYYRDDLITQSGEYKDGKKVGVWTNYQPYNNYEFKTLLAQNKYYIQKIHYQDGEQVFPDGQFTMKYYPSGKTYATIEYNGGKKVGHHKYYHPDGTLSNEEKYDSNGKMIFETVYWPNGQVQMLRSWENGTFRYEGYDRQGNPDSNMKLEAHKMDAMQAFKNREFAEAARLFRKAYNENDARIMDDLANAQSYIAKGSFGGAITEINNARKKAKNPIIEEFYEEIYPLYLQWLDAIFQKHAAEGKVESMEGELQNQLVDLHEEDVPRYQKFIDEAKDAAAFYASVDEAITKFQASNVEQRESFFVDENGQRIMQDYFVKGKYLYPKAMVLLEPLMKKYSEEKDTSTKKSLGQELVAIIAAVEKIPEAEWKGLNKQLKKVNDPTEIRLVLGVE